MNDFFSVKTLKEFCETSLSLAEEKSFERGVVKTLLLPLLLMAMLVSLPLFIKLLLSLLLKLSLFVFSLLLSLFSPKSSPMLPLLLSFPFSLFKEEEESEGEKLEGEKLEGEELEGEELEGDVLENGEVGKKEDLSILGRIERVLLLTINDLFIFSTLEVDKSKNKALLNSFPFFFCYQIF
jgi:hypothetical protein